MCTHIAWKGEAERKPVVLTPSWSRWNVQFGCTCAK